MKDLHQAGLDLSSPAGNDLRYHDQPIDVVFAPMDIMASAMEDPTSPTGGVFAIQRELGLVAPKCQTRMA